MRNTYEEKTGEPDFGGGNGFGNGAERICRGGYRSGDCGDNLTWILTSDGTLTISGTGAMHDFSYFEGYDDDSSMGDGASIGTPLYSVASSIKSVVINNGVTNIGDGAFEYCSSLTSITIPDSVTSIGGRAFYDCSSLTSITVGNGVTSIGYSTFDSCSSLTSITIPDSVTSIGYYAFYHCYILTDVYYSGSEEKWTKISIDWYNEDLTDAKIHYVTTSNCTVTYDYAANGGTSASKETASLTAGESADLTVTATKTGWEFVGWNTDKNATAALSSYKVTSDVTLYAIYKKTLSAKFYSGNNKLQETKTVAIYNNAASGSVTAPTPSAYSGWTVKGWRADKTAGASTISSRASVTINGDKTYYAVYSRTLTLSYNANGGSSTPASQKAEQYYNAGGSKAEKSFNLAAAITRSGYNFGGWAVGSAGGEKHAPESSISISDNTTMYATWTTISTVATPTISVSDINGGKSAAITCSTSNVTIYYTTNGTTPTTSSTKYTGAINLTSVGTTNIKAIAVRSGYNNSSVASKSVTVSKAAAPTASLSEGTITSSTSVSLSCSTSGAVIYFTTNGNTPTTSSTKYTGSITINSTTTLKAIAVAAGYVNSSVAAYTYYTVTFNANGGTGTPSPQIKEENIPLTLSSHKPSKTYVIKYNAAGGSVTPASKNVTCTFSNWNTKENGNGTLYTSGGVYNSNANVTLYAQWKNPLAGTLAVPSRSDYDFIGWFTSAVGGVQITESSTITENTTLYAHWADSYNMGDETYSFANYGDSDSPYGHCFGMSITSAGYHNGLLDIGKIGGNANTSLYDFSKTQKVKQPICYYQGIQGSYSARAIVAGGSSYLYGYDDIRSDWQKVVNYVRNHNYDNTGLLQIGFRKNTEGGHAINFLRYENVNGQDRIYAYDNNFPTIETYFYQDSSGRVRQAPVGTFSGAIDCIALRDSRIYFNSVRDFDATHVLYMAKNAATVQGYTYSYIEGAFSGEDYVMYEIPANQDRVIIIPNRDNADFIYMDTEYSFGKITDETRGELRFSSLDESAGNTDAYFRIFETDSDTPDNMTFEIVDLIPSFSSHQSNLFGSITANIENRTANEQSATVVLGIYDADGKLISSQIKSCDFNGGDNEVTFSNIFLENAANADCRIKCFIWNTLTEMKPMSATIEKNIE